MNEVNPVRLPSRGAREYMRMSEQSLQKLEQVGPLEPSKREELVHIASIYSNLALAAARLETGFAPRD